MFDVLSHFRLEYLHVLNEMERIKNALKPSYLDVYEHIERMLEPLRREHLLISQLAEQAKLLSSPLSEILKANQHWQNLIDQARAPQKMYEYINRFHPSWINDIALAQNNIEQIQAITKLSLGDMAYRMTVAERLYERIDFNSIRQFKDISNSEFLTFRNVIEDMTSSYEVLAGSIKTLPEVTYLPKYVLPSTAREVFITGYALDTIRIPEESEETDDSIDQLILESEHEVSSCIELLQAVDPALATPYRGAHNALLSRNIDRARHVLSSLRELWNHLLHRLAPDEKVISWISVDEKELLHDGRPTRRARVLYICRNLNHEPLSDFVVQDTRALVKMVELFNRVHELDSKLTDEQLRALLLRTDSWLVYILQIMEETR